MTIGTSKVLVFSIVINQLTAQNKLPGNWKIRQRAVATFPHGSSSELKKNMREKMATLISLLARVDDPLKRIGTFESNILINPGFSQVKRLCLSIGSL